VNESVVRKLVDATVVVSVVKEVVQMVKKRRAEFSAVSRLVRLSEELSSGAAISGTASWMASLLGCAARFLRRRRQAVAAVGTMLHENATVVVVVERRELVKVE